MQAGFGFAISRIHLLDVETANRDAVFASAVCLALFCSSSAVPFPSNFSSSSAGLIHCFDDFRFLSPPHHTAVVACSSLSRFRPTHTQCVCFEFVHFFCRCFHLLRAFCLPRRMDNFAAFSTAKVHGRCIVENFLLCMCLCVFMVRFLSLKMSLLSQH